MNIYSGVDIIEIDRIKDTIDKWEDNFITRVFTDKEYKYCNTKSFPYPHLAARFSAKEAVIKSLGNFPIPDIKLKDIEILNTTNGKPEVKLHNKIKKYCKHNKITLELSLSHTKTFAVANAIAIKDGKDIQNTPGIINKTTT